DEADIVLVRIDAERAQRVYIELLDVVRRGFQDHLVLIVVLQPIGVVAVATVLRTARRLDVGRLPRFGADRTQERRGVERARAHLHVVRLQQHAALLAPVSLELEDQFLEREHGHRDRSARFYRLSHAGPTRRRRASQSAAASASAHATTIGAFAQRTYGV